MGITHVDLTLPLGLSASSSVKEAQLFSGGGLDPICGHLFSADPAGVSAALPGQLPGDECEASAPAPRQTGPRAAGLGDRGQGLCTAKAMLQKEQRLHLLPTILWATFVFHFLSFFFSLNHFYKLLKSFSLFSDN